MNTNFNFNITYLLEKINELLTKGRDVKMRNKDRFHATLIDTRVILFYNYFLLNRLFFEKMNSF